MYALVIFFAILAAVAWVDRKTMTIPDLFPGLIFLLAVRSPFWEEEAAFSAKLIGVLSVSLPMLLLALVIPGAFGGGDIKLMAACGAFLGWKRNLLAMFFAVLGGGGWGVWLLAGGKAGPKDSFAFGPFLCMGVAVAALWGEKILSWYLQLFQ